MDYYQGQELWNSGDKYNYPFLPDEIPWTARAINFDLNPDNSDNWEARLKKSIVQTESLVSEQISEQKRTSKKIRLNEEFQRRA